MTSCQCSLILNRRIKILRNQKKIGEAKIEAMLCNKWRHEYTTWSSKINHLVRNFFWQPLGSIGFPRVINVTRDLSWVGMRHLVFCSYPETNGRGGCNTTSSTFQVVYELMTGRKNLTPSTRGEQASKSPPGFPWKPRIGLPDLYCCA